MKASRGYTNESQDENSTQKQYKNEQRLYKVYQIPSPQQWFY